MPYLQKGKTLKSWSSVKKLLEEDRLAPSLRGRVSYFVTRYREAHDDHGRLAVLVDGKELFQANPFAATSISTNWYTLREQYPELTNGEHWELWANRELAEGFGEPYDFYRSFEEYDTQDVETSLASDNPLVRVLAVLDRRVGKRRLKKLAERGFANEPDWVQALIRLRLEAEGISND